MAKIHINIGSNIGDKARVIDRATGEIAAMWPEAESIDLAPIEVSEPWGFKSDNEFLNLGLMIDTGREEASAEMALETLRRLQKIEKAISDAPHRSPDGAYQDRVVDIDLVAIDDLRLDTPELTLPHRHLHDRPFFLKPYQFLNSI